MTRGLTFASIDVGTTKICTLVAEAAPEGEMRVLGVGVSAAGGLSRGMVDNIRDASEAIRASVEKAERSSGTRILSAHVGISGGHVQSLNNRGIVAIPDRARAIGSDDVARVLDGARIVSLPANREILHVIPRCYVVDGQDSVSDPVGMYGQRLDVETHIVTGAVSAIQNLTKCVGAAGVKIDELVVSSLASAEAVVSETEKDLGVAVADVGAGTIDLALFNEGSPFHTAVLPIGGNNVTNDVAIGIKTSLQVAEQLKIQHGTCDLRSVSGDDEIGVAVLGDEAGRTVSRLEVCQIIEARMRETFELLRSEITAAGPGMLPAGLVLTGGAAQLAGTAELGREVLGMPVRIAAPSGMGGLVETLLTPAHATAIGLLQWGAAGVGTEPVRYESAPALGLLSRIRDALRSIFP